MTNNWHHVSTHHNPADIISRGTNPQELASSKLWWNGPSWLAEDEQHWPIQPARTLEVIPEVRQVKYQIMMIQNQADAGLSYLLIQYSLFSKLTRIIFYCLRFIKNIRVKCTQKSVGALNADELNNGTKVLVRIAQQQDFACEIEKLKKNKSIPNHSCIVKLQPFLDKEGLLRVGGRLSNAPIPYEQRHPMILSHLNPLALLILRHRHFRVTCRSSITFSCVANSILDNL
ncbi:unnamed protein product [Lasius platythorax]|uniref:Uncharacterized protein n=1 Tax=Lasius platythorax TaxID=488582 RepID=A0AAV2MZ95_9HYME